MTVTLAREVAGPTSLDDDALATLGGPLGDALDELVERFGGTPHRVELVRARNEHEARTGRVFDEDARWEARTAAFLEWYIVERPFAEAGVAPAALAWREAPSPERRALATSQRSLYAFVEQEDAVVRLVDLLGGGHFDVSERRRLGGVVRGDVVEARLYAWDGRVLFGRTLDYHPAGARETIVAHARRIRAKGGSRADVVDYVASLRLRAEHYRHVPALRVYEASTNRFPRLDQAELDRKGEGE
ncbi:MAG: hypothetical protein EXR73_05070 [Myxococcales bacterium]|nr:hypothetical protein [Myxococcales bacterium]